MHFFTCLVLSDWKGIFFSEQIIFRPLKQFSLPDNLLPLFSLLSHIKMYLIWDHFWLIPKTTFDTYIIIFVIETISVWNQLSSFLENCFNANASNNGKGIKNYAYMYLTLLSTFFFNVFNVFTLKTYDKDVHIPKNFYYVRTM